MRARHALLPALCAAALLVGVDAGAEPAGPALLDLLADWTQRSKQELRLDGAPPPHRSVMAALDYRWAGASADFGALTGEGSGRARPARIEVVVGDDGLDSSRFDPGRRAFAPPGATVERMNLVVEDVPVAIERDLWLATDRAYKGSVARYQAKVAARAAVGGEAPADWSEAPVLVEVDVGAGEAPDHARLIELARSGSLAFRSRPGLDTGTVSARAFEGTWLFADSDGRRVAQPEGYATLRAWASVRLPDGVELSDRRQWVARGSEDLPDAAELRRAVDALAADLLARRDAEPVDYYEGAVVFEGEAASGFFAQLLPPELEGTPPAPAADRSYDEQTRSGPRIGRKLLPDGWSVRDDPGAARPGEAGGFRIDREGVRAEAVELVQDGYVRDLLMSRVPRKEKARSNGHARGATQGELAARMSIWTVEPPRALSDRAFGQGVDRLLRKGNQSRVLVVRRLGVASPGSLPVPTHAVWRATDGTETPVGSLMFQNVDRRTLRDVALAGGGQRSTAYLAGFTPRDRPGDDSGLPTVVRAPERILVLNMEAVFPGPGEQPYALSPSPLPPP